MRVSTHAPSQAIVPGPQVKLQTPAAHFGVPPVGAVQTFPQAPQCCRLFATLMHAPEHAVRFVSQTRTHAPPWHAWPAAQERPHSPQFFGSEARATQASLHSAVPALQCASQRPPAQLELPFIGGAQLTSQAPQFAGSFASSTQRPSHSLKPVLHCSEQVPLHTAVAFAELGQETSQLPQWLGSRVVSTHAPVQLVVPGGHCVTQRPSAHICPSAHASKQPPQCAKLVLVSTQALPQSASP